MPTAAAWRLPPGSTMVFITTARTRGQKQKHKVKVSLLQKYISNTCQVLDIGDVNWKIPKFQHRDVSRISSTKRGSRGYLYLQAASELFSALSKWR